MAQLFKPGEVKVISREGEITLSLQIDLNININSSGAPVVEGIVRTKESNVKSTNEEESNSWMIPDFKPAEKIKFGK